VGLFSAVKLQLEDSRKCKSVINLRAVCNCCVFEFAVVIIVEVSNVLVKELTI
jgi:hypothetical protein